LLMRRYLRFLVFRVESVFLLIIFYLTIRKKYLLIKFSVIRYVLVDRNILSFFDGIYANLKRGV